MENDHPPVGHKFRPYLAQIETHLHEGRYLEAKASLDSALAMPPPTLERELVFWQAYLAGFLIDIGLGLQKEEMVRRGCDWHVASLDKWSLFITRSSLEYNIGNAFSNLHEMARKSYPKPFRPENIPLLLEAKAHYWRAYKTLVGIKPPNLCVNLGNCLDASARIVEAIGWYDEALHLHPEFEMALVNRGRALNFLRVLSDTFSINLMMQARDCFEQALASGRLSHPVREDTLRKLEPIKAWLQKQEEAGHAVGKEEHPISGDELSEYRHFCVQNRLSLCEHALYCNCSAAAEDNLFIPKTTGPIGGDFVPRMEFLLNRVKAEFSLARLAFYQATQSPKEDAWPTTPYDVLLTELGEQEAVGTQNELLRTSFRLCFGILDKIGWGICDLFNLRDGDEPISFESFWKPQGKGRGSKRWDAINQIDNMGLVALYSIASDLNIRSGEWKNFKAWRNALEHGLLVVSEQPEEFQQFSQAFSLSSEVEVVSSDEFAEQSLHLLQLTSSAIFSFVFCVRKEGLKALGSGSDKPSGTSPGGDPTRVQPRITLSPKRKQDK